MSAYPFEVRAEMKDTMLTAQTDEAQSGGIRAAVLGINDGLVTNISLILGVAGATANVSVIELAGLASLVAGACSMAVGEYVSMQAQVDLLHRVLSSVRQAFTDDRERIAGVKTAYVREGLPDDLAAQAAVEIGDDCDKATELYSRVVLGINPGELGSPWIAAFASLVTFAIGAAIPLVPWYVVAQERAAYVSFGISFAAAFVVGALLGRHTDGRWFRGGIRQLVVIALASGITYGVGRLFHVSGR